MNHWTHKNCKGLKERHYRKTSYCSLITSDSPGIKLSCKQDNSKQHHCLEQMKVLSAVAAALFFDYGTYQMKWGRIKKVKLHILAHQFNLEIFFKLKYIGKYLSPSQQLFTNWNYTNISIMGKNHAEVFFHFICIEDFHPEICIHLMWICAQ